MCLFIHHDACAFAQVQSEWNPSENCWDSFGSGTICPLMNLRNWLFLKIPIPKLPFETGWSFDVESTGSEVEMAAQRMNAWGVRPTSTASHDFWPRSQATPRISHSSSSRGSRVSVLGQVGGRAVTWAKQLMVGGLSTPGGWGSTTIHHVHLLISHGYFDAMHGAMTGVFEEDLVKLRTVITYLKTLGQCGLVCLSKTRK